jgi:hypothetical protein
LSDTRYNLLHVDRTGHAVWQLMSAGVNNDGKSQALVITPKLLLQLLVVVGLNSNTLCMNLPAVTFLASSAAATNNLAHSHLVVI